MPTNEDLKRDAQFIAQTAAVMQDKTPLTVETDIQRAWLIISSLQFSCRAPGLSLTMKEVMHRIADEFAAPILKLHPEAAALLNAGWDPNFDIVE